MPRSAWPSRALDEGDTAPCSAGSRTICSTSAPTSRRRARCDGALRIVAAQVDRLEQEIDAMNAESRAARPASSCRAARSAVAALHFARGVVRRAERAAVALHEAEPLNPLLLAYLNRLSDHLFVLARACSPRQEGGDILWQPGASRVDAGRRIRSAGAACCGDAARLTLDLAAPLVATPTRDPALPRCLARQMASGAHDLVLRDLRAARSCRRATARSTSASPTCSTAITRARASGTRGRSAE